ncbi:MAG TPA: hypothetical protein ENF52_06525 [Chloroflexi bacterium]|nr:hypothetical protein [Chloroflexota bacterium]
MTSLPPTTRKPKDRDFIRTPEGMFFCVTGYLHPPERYTAYLKYSPDSTGRWRGGAVAYRREVTYYHASNVADTLRYLEARYPQYVAECPVRGIRFSMVPQEAVAHYYVPQTRLAEVISNPADSLEAIARDLALEIATAAGITTDNLGITGSILIRLHHLKLSDVNLLVYGAENARRVRAVLRDRRCRALAPVDAAIRERWVQEMSAWFPLTPAEARYNVERRWNYGTYRGRFFGIHATRTDDEITEQYGDHIYRGLGRVRLEATLTSTVEALFQPAVYAVDDVEVLEGERAAAQVREIVSYEGRYRDIAEVGERVEALGKLERVDGVPRRLVIGTTALKGREYIKKR